MPRRARPANRPEIMLDAASPVPLYKQLYERLRGAILSGQLEHGAPLPSTRALSHELGVSRTTTILAYEQLVLEGYMESRKGQGTMVARSLPSTLVRQQSGRPPAERPPVQKRSRTRVAARVATLGKIPLPRRKPGQTGGIFYGGEPALELFPYAVWARLIARHARHSLRAYAHYQPPAGYEPLREAIAAQIGVTRGVRCSPEQIILTAGSQGALDLAARTLLDAGAAVWLENPGYFGARGALLGAGARLVPVPVDEQGLVVAIGRERAPDARMVATTPSHQFPTGVTMSLPRRLELLSWAREAGAWILEDDFDSEYRFTGRPLESLQGLDDSGRVLYISTFSKVLFPALRLGYLVAPAELVAPLLVMRRFLDVHLPVLEQMALADFLREGHFARHLRRMRQHFVRRRALLQRELCSQLSGLLEVRAPEAGMHLVGWLPPGKDDKRAAQLAAQVGIAVMPVSAHSLEPLTRGGLVFGFATTPEEAIAPGVKRLAAVLERL